MKCASVFFFFSLILLFSSGCEKCYTCHNVCKVCSEHHSLGTGDTTLTIVVSSSALSQKYYEEYLDSLNSLGWTCRDTASNYSEHFCTATMQKTFQLVNKKEEGLVCTEE